MFALFGYRNSSFIIAAIIVLLLCCMQCWQANTPIKSINEERRNDPRFRGSLLPLAPFAPCVLAVILLVVALALPM